MFITNNNNSSSSGLVWRVYGLRNAELFSNNEASSQRIGCQTGKLWVRITVSVDIF